MQRLLRRSSRQAFFDAVPVVIVVGGLVLIMLTVDPPPPQPPPNSWMLLFFGLGMQTALGTALFFRRQAPLGLAAAVTAAAVVMFLFPHQLVDSDLANAFWVPLAAPFAIYNVIAYATGPRQRAAGWALVAILIVLGTRAWERPPAAILGDLFVLGGPVLLGMYVAAHQRLVLALTDRAERAEREQELLAEQARADERVKLAGEMHDVVTHRVSLMVLQAGALRVSAPGEAERAAAEELRAAGCQALEELRDLVGVLRAPSSDGSDHVDEPDPAGQVPELSALVAESESVGVPVELIQDGNPLLSSPVVARTAYRVVQEALTNVRKHAMGSRVRVHVRYGADRVRLTIRNTAPAGRGGPGDPGLTASGSGTGLLGLRQRVELVSGTLQAGPSREGGFEVDAILPAYVPTSKQGGTGNARQGSTRHGR